MTLREFTRQYCDRDNRIASLSYFGTFAVYFASLWGAVTFVHFWPAMLAFGIVHAFSAIRLYVLQHDTGHLSLFETRAQNEWAGIGLSPFTFAPYHAMRHNHDLHHAHIGNLEHRESGEIHTMTLAEWEKAGLWERLGYRLYRNPLILVPLGAAFTYFIRYRWPKNTREVGVRGVLLHNLMVVGWVAALWAVAGWVGLGVWFAFNYLGGMIGVFMVFLQHNFEDTYWDRRPDLDPQRAALQGSSTLDFGHWFDIATANITCHDVHHFNARIPSYRLRQCRYALPAEWAPRRIGFREAVAALNLKLWDEESERLVPFPPARDRVAARLSQV
ncbi:MAG: fatty acid desaturase [Rhodobacteraceae bacterium]|nr:fatty acid desaturase [Paracoccaceae bacterium]